MIASRCLRRHPWAVFLHKWDSAFSFSRASFEVAAGLAGHIEVLLVVRGKQALHVQPYLVIPGVSSELRDFYPVRRVEPEVIASNATFTASDRDCCTSR